MKKIGLLLIAGVFCLSVAAAHAQGGNDSDGPCDSSPENPTLVLAALGSSGAALAALRVRLSARKKKR